MITAMRKNRINAVSLAPILGLLLTSCGASIAEYQKFAAAGKEYYGAVELLADSFKDIIIESSSEKLLRNDTQNEPVEVALYTRVADDEAQAIDLLAGLKLHSRLLKRYFLALENLATSDAPDRAQAATNSIVEELTGISAQLSSNPWVIAEEKKAGISAIPALALKYKIKGALGSELLNRKDTIYRELLLQEYTIKAINSIIASELDNIRENRENRSIYLPYISETPIDNKDGWVKKRVEIKALPVTIQALTSVENTATKLREAYTELLSDDLTLTRARILLTEVEEFADVVNKIKS